MATLTKRHYRVTLDLEIIDDSHPSDFNWNKMLDIGDGEEVKLLGIEDLDEDIWIQKFASVYIRFVICIDAFYLKYIYLIICIVQHLKNSYLLFPSSGLCIGYGG